jgi:hypothetical protein
MFSLPFLSTPIQTSSAAENPLPNYLQAGAKVPQKTFPSSSVVFPTTSGAARAFRIALFRRNAALNSKKSNSVTSVASVYSVVFLVPFTAAC